MVSVIVWPYDVCRFAIPVCRCSCFDPDLSDDQETSVTRGGSPRVKPSKGGGSDTRLKLNFLRLNLQRTQDKRRWKAKRVGVGDETAAKKSSSVLKKR